MPLGRDVPRHQLPRCFPVGHAAEIRARDDERLIHRCVKEKQIRTEPAFDDLVPAERAVGARGFPGDALLGYLPRDTFMQKEGCVPIPS